MEPHHELAPRIGTFLTIVGFGLMVLFLASEFSHEPNFNYLFLGLAVIFVGYLFGRRRKPQAESARFGSIRRARARARQRREEQHSKQRKGDSEEK